MIYLLWGWDPLTAGADEGRVQCRHLAEPSIEPEGIPRPPTGQYSEAIRARGGHFLFIAGQVAQNSKGEIVGRGDAEAQTRQVFNQSGPHPEERGSLFSDVVEFTTYLVGVESVRPFLKARAELFVDLYPNADYPANTLINIESLGGSDALVEIKAVAVLP